MISFKCATAYLQGLNLFDLLQKQRLRLILAKKEKKNI
jgi:hypothetical protein